jgi:hypothetical protein
VKQLLDRPTAHFQRIEAFISGVIDSLWLANPFSFELGSSSMKTIRTIVRKIFKVGANNLQLLVNYWKEWTKVLLHTVARTELKKPVELSPENFFRDLHRLDYIESMLTKDNLCVTDCEAIGHLTSTRQMPYMGKATEVEAKKEFLSVITSQFNIEPTHDSEMVRCAGRIGRLIRRLRGDQKISEKVFHFSATSSGELNFSIEKGGQAAALKAAINKWLLPIQSADFMEDTPFGFAEHRQGVPLWKTLFVDEQAQNELLFANFDETYPWIKDLPKRIYGLNQYTGFQIMYVAWKEMDLIPSIRASTVAELGNKARIVTLSAYWLGVLQAPLAHMLKDLLKVHPSCRSSFTRGDQAWAAAQQMSRIPGHIASQYSVLSSDLKNATNAQSYTLSRSMLRAFIVGAGFPVTDYVTIALDTLCPRIVYLDDDIHVTSRGIMMGEPLAKPSLTLLNLVVEELAFLKYKNRLALLNNDKASPDEPWRCYHVGGDDHLAIGPDEYLDLITDMHERSGSQISEDKHGKSRRLVSYTERILCVFNLVHNLTGPIGEDKVLLADHVKVRLLEQGQSTMIKKDNKNVAIGKSQQLVKTLDWLPRGSYPMSRIRAIRDLFIVRMKGLIPSANRDLEAYHSIHLPTKLGGYGLGLREELIEHLMKSKVEIRKVVTLLSYGLDAMPALRLLSRLNANISERSVQGHKWYEDEMVAQFREYPGMVGAIDAAELKTKFPAATFAETIEIAERHDWYSIEKFARDVTRGNMFKELLTEGVSKKKIFQTRPWIDEFDRIRPRLDDEVGYLPDMEIGQLSLLALQDLLARCSKSWWLDVSQVTCFDRGESDDMFDFFDEKLGVAYAMRTPALRVGSKFLGFRTTVTGNARRVRPRSI